MVICRNCYAATPDTDSLQSALNVVGILARRHVAPLPRRRVPTRELVRGVQPWAACPARVVRVLSGDDEAGPGAAPDQLGD